MSVEKFIQTLEILKVPNYDKYSPSDFEDICLNPELNRFLEYFCTLNEDNVLTPEEVNEFAKISPAELEELEKLAYGGNFCKSRELEDEKRAEEEEYLSEELKHIQGCCQNLQTQKQLLVKHKDELSAELKEYEDIQAKLTKVCSNYQNNLIPQAEDQIKSTLKTIHELHTELKSVINTLLESKCILPTLNETDIEEYYETEEKIINFVQNYIENNFQFKDEEMKTLVIPGLTNDMIMKEIHLLCKSGKSIKMSAFRHASDYEKILSSMKFAKDYDAGIYDYIKDASSAQLVVMLNEQQMLNEKLSKKEDMLMTYLEKAVSENMEAQCSHIVNARSNEVLQSYKLGLARISQPLQQLCDQRSRLELLILYSRSFQQHLKDIKLIFEEASYFVESEHQSSIKREEIFEECLGEDKEECEPISKTEDKKDYLSPDSLLLSAFKILNDFKHEDFSSITTAHVIGDMQLLQKKMEEREKEIEDRDEILKQIEQEYFETRSFALEGDSFLRYMDIEKNLNIQLHHMDMLVTDFSNAIQKNETFYHENKKNLLEKSNLMLCRRLFVYALTERPTFEAFIDKIKMAKKMQDGYLDEDDSLPLT